MNIIKTSIPAITVTILFFLSIFFISLFKGITLYNINIQNIHIKKILIKIEQNRINANINISSITQKDEKIEFNKIFTYLKLLNYIKKLTITAPNLYIKYDSYFLIIKNNEINFKAYIKKFFPEVNLVISTFKYKNIELDNINLNLKDKIIYSKINGSLYYQNYLLKFNGNFYPLNNELTINLFSPKLSIVYNNTLIQSNNLISKIKIRLNKHKVLSTTKIKYIKLTYQNMPINLKNIYINQNNEKLKILIDNGDIKNIKKLKNIFADNIKIDTNIKNFITSINIDRINSTYQQYLITVSYTHLTLPTIA
jgi:hypothetical protein